MTSLLLIILIVLIMGFVLFFYFLNKKSKTSEKDQSLLMLQNQINEINRTMDTKLGESAKIMRDQYNHSTKIITDVTEKLTKLDETNKQVINFADQLQNLQDILKNPKQRGVFGEYYLETLLKSAFQPHQYQMQYKFKDGTIVDAALFYGDKIIPIDSKFSLENYNRIAEERDPKTREELEKVFKSDLKKRIDETSKYIRPNENTMELAFMFIPAEGIYYDLLINKVGVVKVNTRDLIDYAINEKKVHIVSPTTFYVALQTLIHGMQAYQIQESTQQILKNVVQLSKHINSYESFLKKLGNNLGTTVSMYNQAYKEFQKIDKDVVKIAGGESRVEALEIEKPREEI